MVNPMEFETPYFETNTIQQKGLNANNHTLAVICCTTGNNYCRLSHSNLWILVIVPF